MFACNGLLFGSNGLLFGSNGLLFGSNDLLFGYNRLLFSCVIYNVATRYALRQSDVTPETYTCLIDILSCIDLV